MTQFKSLLDYVLETGSHDEVWLVHVSTACDVVVETWTVPVGLEELVRAAADHECRE